MDAFYASVEELDNPSLKNKAVVVSGRSPRSVITTANYEARKYGIHSAMPLFIAKNLCPNLTIVPMRRERYLEKSEEIYNVLSNYTDIIERVSIDESYLDIRDSHMDPVDLAKDLMANVEKSTGLTVSVGISYNKFLAKLASDWNKPNGYKVINREDVPEILMDFDIKIVHGLGEKSQERLRNIGINKVSELMNLSEDYLYDLFGKMGPEVYHRIRGIDRRQVKVDRVRKSISVERTFSDTRDRKILKQYLEDYVDELYKDLQKKNFAFTTLTIKFKRSDFTVHTHSKTFPYTVVEYEDILEKSMNLFEDNFKGEKLRLMGITASNLVSLDRMQLSFI